MPHSPEDKKRALVRLKRIKGQVEALERAVEAGTECSLLLQQIATPDDVFQDHYRALAAELAEAWQRGLDTISTIS